MLGPVIDGSFVATTRDVDDWIEHKGNIESAFDGMRAAAGAGTQINGSQGVFLTEKVAFAFFPQSDYSWLIVVNRSNPAHTVGFRADAERLIHRLNDVHDNTYSVRVGQIRRVIENYRPLSFASPPLPQHELASPPLPQHELVSLRAVQSDFERLRTEMSQELQRAEARFERLQTEIDRSLQRAQDWGVMSNAAVLMLTLCMAAAHLM
jgi:hypothetical protein